MLQNEGMHESGPVRTVVWEGRSREAPPYPDFATALRVTRRPPRWEQLIWPKARFRPGTDRNAKRLERGRRVDE